MKCIMSSRISFTCPFVVVVVLFFCNVILAHNRIDAFVVNKIERYVQIFNNSTLSKAYNFSSHIETVRHIDLSMCTFRSCLINPRCHNVTAMISHRKS